MSQTNFYRGQTFDNFWRYSCTNKKLSTISIINFSADNFLIITENSKRTFLERRCICPLFTPFCRGWTRVNSFPQNFVDANFCLKRYSKAFFSLLNWVLNFKTQNPLRASWGKALVRSPGLFRKKVEDV